MRTRLLILLFFPLFGFGQTQWADSLQKLEKRDARKDYDWFKNLSDIKKTEYINTYFTVKQNAAHEARLREVTDSTANVVNTESSKQVYIAHLRTLGFSLTDNVPSKADWRRAYNHPEWFGKNWEAKAIDAKQTGTLKDFLQFCRQYGY
jgi:hypothetical protein